jgi:putative hemolysin
MLNGPSRAAGRRHARAQSGAESRLVITLAANVSEVRAAQRLRYRVFAEEMGAEVPGREQGIDCDIFDAYCDHLIVTDRASGEVVGTYRLLPWARARRAGGFYSQHEFDLSAIADVLPRTVEAGRACVHPDYRGGPVLLQLWAAIIEYVRRMDAQYLMGCVSIGLADDGAAVNAVDAALRALDVPSPGVTPIKPYPLCPDAGVPNDAVADLSPLLRTYIRLGASVCYAPAWDTQFNCADYFILLSMARISEHYARRLAAGLPASVFPTTKK